MGFSEAGVHTEKTGVLSGSWLMGILSCSPEKKKTLPAGREDRSTGPKGSIAPFARSNYYREAVIRFKQVAVRMGAEFGIPVHFFRIFSNSSFPEKYLAARAGLGFIGKNSLLISHCAGSLCIIAGIKLPLMLETGSSVEDTVAPGLGCGTCSACADACPVQAIRKPGSVDSKRCLQAMAGSAFMLPPEIMEIWGNRIYGCQICQDVCPYNRSVPPGPGVELGFLGSEIPLEPILVAGAAGCKNLFKGTALGMNFIDKRAIVRNAIIAAGNLKASSLRGLVDVYKKQEDPILSRTAEWACRKITVF